MNLDINDLSEDQKRAIMNISIWYTSQDSKQIYTLSGGPGTGKTFLVNYIMDILNLHHFNIAFCAYTGRASLVLREKGLPAKTIHQTVYNTQIIEGTEIDEKTNKEKIVKKLITTLKNDLNSLIKLIIIDEISMVPEDILKDIMSFGIKILAIGDKDQLPPVKGKVNNLLDNPDSKLLHNYRQGNVNEILETAYEVLKTGKLEYGKYSNNFIVCPKNMMDIKHLEKVDQVICTTNKLRNDINVMFRKRKGFDKSDLPIKGDKLISIKNEWNNLKYSPKYKDNFPIINGLIGYAKEDSKVTPYSRIATIEFSPVFDSSMNYELSFAVQDFMREDDILKPIYKENLSELEYGYAITIHKSQGSEFDSVAMVVDKSFSRDKSLYNKLIFTGMTRARKKLIVYI